MSQTVIVELPMPANWRRLRLPPSLHSRLQDLLDKQDRTGKLSAKERREARELTELVDFLSVMRLQAKLARKRRAS